MATNGASDGFAGSVTAPADMLEVVSRRWLINESLIPGWMVPLESLLLKLIARNCCTAGRATQRSGASPTGLYDPIRFMSHRADLGI
jgi:hypothetical protein